MLASAFIADGVESLRGNDDRSLRFHERLGVPNPQMAARAVSGVQVGAGLLLAANKLPRLTAFALALSAVPTLAAVRPGDDGAEPRSIVGRVGLVGGALLAAADTGGRESLPHRARRRAKDVAPN
jgi:uncharacterized membrane protein YphA (DoxX/SURF4 family)